MPANEHAALFIELPSCGAVETAHEIGPKEHRSVRDAATPGRRETAAICRELSGVATFPGVSRSAGRARAFVREVLGTSAAADTVELCVSELVANAVCHSSSGDGGQVTVAIGVNGDRVRVEVTDDGDGRSAPHVMDDPSAEHGRGLMVVDALAARWGVIPGPAGSTVWFEYAG
ncbi:Histidine kinase-like ATPase domain-containing protein [Actinomadura madurae]|uniref:Histidine kinase-like ATPase domain-containing protein n=1 Tax=Actinomadura madurae TaxID=1993 RepID=A0A1I5MDH3_9ACTN|nr:ATP-binding protein [Actinomadura madurae]SFP07569.1 Histidine kinase-like ATPase domain-containing protein [Actinomadura madurae]